jgi:hypothetical protein
MSALYLIHIMSQLKFTLIKGHIHVATRSPQTTHLWQRNMYKHLCIQICDLSRFTGLRNTMRTSRCIKQPRDLRMFGTETSISPL